MWGRTQGPEETVDQFVTAILKLARAVPITDQNLIKLTVLRGLKPQLRASVVTQQTDTVEALADAARRVEAMMPASSTSTTDPQVLDQDVAMARENQKEVRRLAERIEQTNVTNVRPGLPNRSPTPERRRVSFQETQFKKPCERSLPPKFSVSADRTRLTITNVQKWYGLEPAGDLMVIQCVASNKHGDAYKQVYVNVFEPTMLIHAPKDVLIDHFGDEVSFYAHANTDPSTPLTYTWYFGSNKLVNDSKYSITDDGRNLTITDVEQSDVGEYRCEASNGVSTAIAVAELQSSVFIVSASSNVIVLIVVPVACLLVVAAGCTAVAKWKVCGSSEAMRSKPLDKPNIAHSIRNKQVTGDDYPVPVDDLYDTLDNETITEMPLAMRQQYPLPEYLTLISDDGNYYTDVMGTTSKSSDDQPNNSNANEHQHTDNYYDVVEPPSDENRTEGDAPSAYQSLQQGYHDLPAVGTENVRKLYEKLQPEDDTWRDIRSESAATCSR